MRTWVLALPMLIGLTACNALPKASDGALTAALDKPLRRCAGALTGDDMPTAREACLPVVAIYQAAIGGQK